MGGGGSGASHTRLIKLVRTELYLRWDSDSLTINASVVYMARDVMILMEGKSISRVIVTGGPWKSRLFWALWNGTRFPRCHFKEFLSNFKANFKEFLSTAGLKRVFSNLSQPYSKERIQYTPSLRVMRELYPSEREIRETAGRLWGRLQETPNKRTRLDIQIPRLGSRTSFKTSTVRGRWRGRGPSTSGLWTRGCDLRACGSRCGGCMGFQK